MPAFVFVVAYFALMHAIPIANMTGYGARLPGAAITDLFAAASVGFTGLYLYRRSRPEARPLTPLDLLVMTYIAICVASFVLYFTPSHPSQPLAFAYGVHYLLLPIPLYFVAKVLRHARQERALNWIIFLNLGMALLGLLLFYARPEFYTNYLRAYYAAARNLIPDELIYLRLTSYMGSTAVGILAAVTIVLAVRQRLRLPALALVLAVMVAAALLSQQRGGLLVTGLALAYYLVAPDGRTAIKLALLLIGLVALGMVALSFEARYGGVIAYTLQRFADFGSALSERLGSYRIGWQYFLEAPFGLGLGATSASAFNAGLNFGEEVTDANFLRILADLGAHGLFCFGLILLVGMVRALRSGTPGAWLLFVAIYAIVALGTNVFDSYYVAHVFWFVLGIIDSRAEARLEQRAEIAFARTPVVPELAGAAGHA